MLLFRQRMMMAFMRFKGEAGVVVRDSTAAEADAEEEVINVEETAGDEAVEVREVVITVSVNSSVNNHKRPRAVCDEHARYTVGVHEAGCTD